ncbi:MAG TPA: two-component regulator propeller domain-containing protein [Rectinemataceae bacterium]|nr:two-component regulator propeller domain-containing protein [Rectinemataceae bacterium]
MKHRRWGASRLAAALFLAAVFAAFLPSGELAADGPSEVGVRAEAAERTGSPDPAASLPSRSPAAPREGAALFSVLGPREGLSNSSVSSIVQDRRGFLWFGTQDGLDRYDGYSFKTFETVPFDAHSLSDDTVQTLYLDGDTLWVGTYGGLDRLDLGTERFTVYRHDPRTRDSLCNNTVVAISRDAQGRLWVGTLDGLDRFDQKKGIFIHYDGKAGDPKRLQSDVIRALKLDKEGRLWIGTSGGGLSLYDNGRDSFTTYRHEPGNPGSLLSDYVMSIDEDSSGSLWLGTWYGGISRFDPATGRFENHPTPDRRIYVVSAARPGVIFAGSWGGGLFEYDIASGRFTRYKAGRGQGSLSNDVVYSIYADDTGELWFGTNGGGVDRLGNSWRHYRALAAGPDTFPRGKVYVIQIDPRGDLWAGIYNAGLARRDAKTGKWTIYRHDPGNPRSLPNDIVNFAFVDSRERLWFGTNDGLARFDRKRGDFTVIRPDGSPDGLSSEIVYAMDEDRGGFWIGTYRGGLDYLDAKSGRFRHFAHDSGDPTSLSDNLVYCLQRDAQGRLWVGTNDGLDRLEGSSFVRYYYDPDRSSGISNDSIRTMYLDSRGLLWIGTSGGGLMRYESETDSFVTYTTADGLSGNSIVRILEDRDSNLWIATQRGLVLYDRAAGVFRELTLFGDLKNAEFFPGAFEAPDWSLYFGASDLVYHFTGGRYEYNTHRPPVVLTAVNVDHRPAVLPTAAPALERLALSYRDKEVDFDFAALDFREPERNRYAYRLEGFDRSWIQAGTSHRATYTNLPGGDYIFRVRGSNDDGLWNEQGLSLPVHVRIAPWLSVWAWALYACLFAGGVFLLVSRLQGAALRTAKAELSGARSSLAAAEEKIELLSVIDPLTRITNRRRLDEALEQAFARAARGKETLAAVMIDIDSFKAYNDRYGRLAGDECLRRIAGCITSALERATDVASRYGGEEFLVLLPDTELDGAVVVAERIRAAVEQLSIVHGESRAAPVVTVSAGCAALRPESGVNPATLVSAADRALFAAKEGGRNRVER